MNAATNHEDPALRSLLDAAGVPFTSADQDAVYAVGRVLYERADHQRAADVFRLLALLAPMRSRSWASLAACHEALGEVERARVLYALALDVSEHDNHRPVAAAYKARLDLEVGDEEAAAATLELFDRDAADPALLALVDTVARATSRTTR